MAMSDGGHCGSGKRDSVVKLGEYLVQKDLVPGHAIEAAVLEQKVTGERLGWILVRNGWISYGSLVEALVDFAPDNLHAEKATGSRIPVEIHERYGLFFAAVTDTTLYFGALRREKEAQEIVRMYYPDKSIVAMPVSMEQVETFLEVLWKQGGGDHQGPLHDLNMNHEDVLDMILRQALVRKASDIHIEPRIGSYSIFLRIDGVRQHFHEGSLEEYATMASQAKDRGSIDIAERRQPHDGSFQVEHNGRLIDIRVATAPTPYGEKLVLRLLDPDTQPSLDRLGITRIDQWRKGISRRNGVVLITGATGSGKTTTQTATLREAPRFQKAISTIEDPVEYRIPFITHVSVNPAVGLDFSRGVRSFMRMDPDWIVVGEVRDEETARNMIRAAETGHLVMATMHTNDIRSSASRLRDIGVEPKELAYILRAVLSQTLIRKSCPDCPRDERNAPLGCPSCGGTGYKGRTVVSECQYFGNETDVRRLLDGEVWWPTMVQDAYEKHLKGETTYEEVSRVFGAELDEYLALTNQNAQEQSF